jgi:hypothetical protein
MSAFLSGAWVATLLLLGLRQQMTLLRVTFIVIGVTTVLAVLVAHVRRQFLRSEGGISS